MGNSGGGGSTSTSSTKVELPKWYEPMAQSAATGAYNLGNRPYERYPGTRVAPLAPEQQLGLTMTGLQALNNPVTQGMQQQTVDTLGGRYLNPTTNPAWEPTMQRLSDAYRQGTAATTNAAFSKGQAFGPSNSAFNQYTAMNNRAFGDTLAGAAGDLYNFERGNQMKALQMAPATQQAQYADLNQLMGVGSAYRQYEQDLFNQGYETFGEQRQYPWTQLQNFAGLGPALLGNSGMTTATGANPNQGSRLAGAAGGALAGGAGAAMIPAIASTGYGIPIAALLGAIGGGLLS